MNKLFYSLLLTLTIVILPSQGMENPSDSKHPEYQTYQGTVIDARIIGSLALAHPVPEQDALVIKKWRDENKPLLVALTDFTYLNSAWRTSFNNNIVTLKEKGIENQSKWSYVFELPTTKEYYVQIAGPVLRVANLKERAGKFEELDAIEKCDTFQTISKFAYYLRYLDTKEKNNFTRFTIPATYLVPLADTQDKTIYSDNNCFVVQQTRPATAVTVCEHKERMKDVNGHSFKELLTAIAPIPLWDISANLLIDENDNLLITDIEQGCNANPDHFLNKSGHMYNHLTITGFEELYGLCSENKELQHQVQQYIEDKVTLAESSPIIGDQQKRLNNLSHKDQ